MARPLQELRAEFTALPEWARERATELANACSTIAIRAIMEALLMCEELNGK